VTSLSSHIANYKRVGRTQILKMFITISVLNNKNYQRFIIDRVLSQIFLQNKDKQGRGLCGSMNVEGRENVNIKTSKGFLIGIKSNKKIYNKFFSQFSKRRRPG
jgi:hypothetical protein